MGVADIIEVSFRARIVAPPSGRFAHVLRASDLKSAHAHLQLPPYFVWTEYGLLPYGSSFE